jgi:hypothetical protein
MQDKFSNEEINHLRTLISRRTTDLMDKEARVCMQIKQVSDGSNPNYAKILGEELDMVRKEMANNKTVSDKLILAQIEMEIGLRPTTPC